MKRSLRKEERHEAWLEGSTTGSSEGQDSVPPAHYPKEDPVTRNQERHSSFLPQAQEVFAPGQPLSVESRTHLRFSASWGRLAVITGAETVRRVPLC